jgi:AraC family transcriptional activator of pobA
MPLSHNRQSRPSTGQFVHANAGRHAMTSVPNFALYGDAASPAWADLVHVEWIPERSSRYDWEIEPHVHDALVQVLHPVKGGGEVFIDDRKWPLEAPCLVVVPARSVHGFHWRSDVDGPVITAAQRPLETVAAAISPALLRHIREPAVLRVDPAARHADALMPLFEAIERESDTPRSGPLGAGMALLAALFVQVARISESRADDADPRSRKAAQIERFRALLDAGFRERQPVEHYANELGMTTGHLGRLCREVLGVSTLDAINARVVHEAQRELVYSSLSIKQLSAALGFEDEAYFGRFFRKHTGQRPSDFRLAARRQLGEA